MIALNRAGEAAKTVRGEWLTQFTRRKAAPSDAAGFLLTGCLAGDPAASHEATQPWRRSWTASTHHP